ncbi:MAG: hypothetical protein ABSB19_04125 [Methylomonas sp.]|jgi:hypothetical protein
MFRYIKIAAIACMFFTSTAFAHEHHGHYGYGNGYGYGNRFGYNHYYGGYYGGGYVPMPVPVVVPPQPYYAQPPMNYGYVQQAPVYGPYRSGW